MGVRKISLFIIAVILIAGTAVRIAGLHKHFTHIDDIGVASTILKSKAENADKNIFVRNFISAKKVPENWTYAPAQFWLTSWLLNETQSYSEKLFWGRFPSFLFGMLTLTTIVYFFRKYNGEDSWPQQILAIGLLAFSWENIIYCQQMESYSIGVFSITLMMTLLVSLFRKAQIQYKDMIRTGALMSLLCFAQYQVIFFLPAFFLSLFLFHLQSNEIKKLVLLFSVPASMVLLTFFYLYKRYLQHHLSLGLNWNVGIHEQFLFDLSTVNGLAEKIIYIFRFFIQNFFATLKSNLAFIPEETSLFRVVAFLFALLFVLGVVSIATSKDKVTKFYGVFILVVAVTWMLLCVAQKITFSPTRHSLVLQPLYIVIIVEGIKFLTNRTKLKHKALSLNTLICVMIGFMFAFFYKSVSASRNDPFDEKEMEKLLADYRVEEIYPYHLTLNFDLMKNIHRNYSITDGNNFGDKKTSATTICLLSTRKPYEYKTLQSGKYFIKNYVLQPQDTVGADYKLIYKKEIFSDTEVDFNRHTRNGNNVMFLYIYRKAEHSS